MRAMLGNPGAFVYGTLTVGALLAAEAAERETYADTVGAVAIAIALLLYWLAHAYSEYAAQRLERRLRITLSGLAHSLVEELSIVVGAAAPLVALLICWAAGVRLTSAVTAALWTAAAMIVLEEMVAGMRAELSARALIAQTAAGAVLGVLVIALHAVLH